MKLVDLLSGFADADWGNSSSRRSTSGMVMLYNKSPIMWKSKMQKTTALSTAEAEYYSASMAGCEVLYLRDLLHRLGFTQKRPTLIYEDNTACIEWGHHVIGGRERAKHIDIRKHFAHETIQKRQMRFVKVDTSNQLANIFTKPLQLPQFLSCQEGILLGKRAVELPPAGPHDSGGGRQSPSTPRRGWGLRESDSKTSDSKD